MADDGGSFWSVAQCYPQQEPRAVLNLERQGFETFFPHCIARKGKRKREVVQPLFPSYIFVALSDDIIWGPIANTYGVRRLLTFQNGKPYREPSKVSVGLVEGLRLLASEPAAPAQPVLIPPGTTVVIRRGPFSTRIGLVQLSGAERVKLLLDVFGREVTVELATGDVEALAPAPAPVRKRARPRVAFRSSFDGPPHDRDFSLRGEKGGFSQPL
jgi:transcriptional antiterminator RfaH